MGENTDNVTGLLEWYDTWNKNLDEYIEAEDYAKIIDIHFQKGLRILSAMKNHLKENKDVEFSFKDKFEILRSKLITINSSRKYISGLLTKN